MTVPVVLDAVVIGAGVGLLIGGLMFARVLYSFAVRGEAVRLFHRP